jgi:hypothetical protein
MRMFSTTFLSAAVLVGLIAAPAAYSQPGGGQHKGGKKGGKGGSKKGAGKKAPTKGGGGK